MAPESDAAAVPAGPPTSGPGAPVQPPAIALPKGGGAIRGIGEKFAANPVTGTGSLSVPIAVSPGRSGFGPQLALSYDSGSGNGIFGFGWSLSLPSIMRKTDKGLPRYDDSDVFILSGAEDLVPVLVEQNGRWVRDEQPARVLPDGSEWEVTRYRPRVEGLFARIERWTETKTGGTHWRSISKDNVTTIYGRTAESRVADPGDPQRVFSWLICESYDDRGNALLYRYASENGDGVDGAQAHERNRTPASRSANRHLKRIAYGNVSPRTADEDLRQRSDWMFEVVFDYGDHDADEPAPAATRTWPCRSDPFSSYRAGVEIRTYRLCRRVLMFHHFPAESDVGADCLVRSTDFAYREDAIASFVTSITQSGYRRRANGTYVRRSLPLLELEYSEAVVDHEVRELDADSLENLPSGLDGAGVQWVDLDGEGAAGVLIEQADGWLYKRNLSPGGNGDGVSPAAAFAPVELVAEQPALAARRTGRRQLLDLAGDGRLDLVDLDRSLAGFHERTEDEDWSGFVAFESMPNVAWDDPNLRLVDLTGDGHADVLIADDRALTWYPSLAEAGFGPPERVAQVLDEEKGPRLVFADGTESIYLADMSGDGLSDLVRIRNREVCYWPNLGYGRFGGRVVMDGAPWFDVPDLFAQRRVRLADIDGSGVTDIVYLGRDGVHLYFNQSGNGWSDAHELTELPPVDDLSSAQVLDLLGTGTACLVWSSPLPSNRAPLRYVDLMGGQKPHLLVRVANNLGAETHVEYAPSTKFYVQDRLAGKPWITRLPFPVHVVERVETCDRVSGNRFTTRYAYHHGYFDGQEREFRGFGLVEQRDTEEFAALASGGVLGPATNVDAASHVPPVLVKTWFHTGAYLDGRRISRHFEDEYWREDAEGVLLDDTVLPDTIRRANGTRAPFALSADEAREAARALKGSILRQEVYALDGREESDRPYTVSERNYTLEPLQLRGGNRHAVFFVHPRETVDFRYERKLYEIGDAKVADPRVTHSMTLVVDDFGNVVRSLAAAYGRRHEDPDPALHADERNEQKRTLVTYTDNAYTKPIDLDDAYRAPLLCDTRTYELLNVSPPAAVPGITSLLQFDGAVETLRTVAVGDHDLPYEDVAGVGARLPDPYRRLVEHVRVLFRRNDLTGPLPLFEIESLALPFEGYRLAYTGSLLASVYNRDAEDLLGDASAVLAEAGYVRSKDLTASGVFPAADTDDEWWIPCGTVFYSVDRQATFAQELAAARGHFFLPRRYHDAFDNATTVHYDAYDLLVEETHDALGNRMTVGERDATGAIVKSGNDYRVLQPSLVMDANRNRSAVAFDALGLVVASAVMGKPEEQLGDSLAAVEADFAESGLALHLEDPLADPHTLLQGATIRLAYDLSAYARTRGDPQPQPSVVYTLARETHESELAAGETSKVRHSFSYVDGFGREIQRKAQAEPGALVEGGAEVAARWVGSGWTIFDNKGRPVRQYEPFFSNTHRFEFARTVGVSSVLCYDPLGRVLATVHPNHTYEKVVFEPWRQESWDVNDTVLEQPAEDSDVGVFFRRLPPSDYTPTWHARRSGGALGVHEQAAAAKAAVHAATPTRGHVDPLGRPLVNVAHNRFDRDGATVDVAHRTRLRLDIEGNERAVVDARDRIVMRREYDMLGRPIRTASMEAGGHWILDDATAKPVLAWDSRGHTIRTDYDALRRPTKVHLRVDDGPTIVVQETVYGEAHANPEEHNLRAKPYRVRDQAGELTTGEYDFRGNLLRSERRLAVDYRQTLDWSGPVPLEDDVLATSTAYDALDRPVRLITPDTSVIRPTFNEAGLLERLEVNLRGSATATRFVEDIDYDARGRRTSISYGNGARTRYEYDPETFRLTRLLTSRGSAFPGDCPNPGRSPCGLQNLRYTYDPIGNITRIQDDAQQTIFFSNRRVEPSADYTYDAVYRLIGATGREHLGQASVGGFPPSAPVLHPGDASAMGRYRERYSYDEVGNLLELFHASEEPSHSAWKRSYVYGEPSLLDATETSNRLTRTTVSGGSQTYTHDAHGNMTTMPHLPLMRWDHRDQLQATSRQVVTNGGTPETTYYVYDAAGTRVRKVIEHQAAAGVAATRMKERIYVGGFERYREYDAPGETMTLERETLHVGDDDRRAALVETRTAGADGSPARVVRYQLANHLGSATLELDESGQILSYEEYYPYGGTSYEGVASLAETPKRYRASAKERDEESGLYCHGARYYAPWLGRWTACDVLFVDGPNLYQYVKSSPTVGRDRTGRATADGKVTSLPFPEETTGGKVTSLRFRDASRVEIGDTGAVFLDENRKEFLRLSAGTFNKIVSATGIDLKQATRQEGSSTEFHQWLVQAFYAPFSSGNPAATNVVGEGKFRFETTTQKSSDTEKNDPHGMECFWTTYANQLKSLGLIPPDMTRSDFEHTFTDIHPESAQRPLSVLIKRDPEIGFPAAKEGIKDKDAAPKVFRDIANAFANDKNNEWAAFTGMAGKRFEAERLAGKGMIERIEAHWALGHTVFLAQPGHYLLGVSTGGPGKRPLRVDPIGDNPTGPLYGLDEYVLTSMRGIKWGIAVWPK